MTRRTITSASQVLFSETEFWVEHCLTFSPRDLATVLSTELQAMWAVRFLAVTALAEGILKEKIALVLDYAAALDVREAYLRQLSEAAAGNLPWVLTDMMIQNIKSLWDQPWRDEDDSMELFFPYTDDRADPVLVARHEALGLLPKGTLGRDYWEIYKKNGYAFPGDPKASTLPSHVPTIRLTSSAATTRRRMEKSWSPRAFDPEQFWRAWVRGSQMTVDLFSSEWDFWAHVEEPVERLRQRYLAANN